jgi:hypothetical protein
MSAVILRKSLAIATLLAALSACSQNPQFKINSANRVYASFHDLNILLAQADLGTFRKPSSFAANADSYATVIGGFEVGRFAAVGLSSAAPSATASVDPLDQLIGRCIDQIRQMADTHRTTGIAPASAIRQSVQTSCEQAVLSVAANEDSALIVTTAAGYL